VADRDPLVTPASDRSRRGRPETAVGLSSVAAVTGPRNHPFEIVPYRALETLLADGKVRAIGVSNFMVDHLTRLLDRAQVVPAVNQIEVHPYFQQPEVQAFNAQHGILTQAWSPIGGITFYRDGEHTSTLEDPVILAIAQAHGKSAAQVMLRWHLQHGRSAIPKSTKPERIAENIDIFDFELTAEEMAAIDGLDTGRRGGPEPEAITLEAFGRDIPEA
jgi:diketogulonate reductase-like aldo/keto reductase